MEEAKVHCPGCNLALRVPATAAGRTARCPSCGNTFMIPKPSDLVEETISTWIEEDVDNTLEEHHKQWEQRHEEMEKLAAQHRAAAKLKAGHGGHHASSHTASAPPPPTESAPKRHYPLRSAPTPPPPIDLHTHKPEAPVKREPIAPTKPAATQPAEHRPAIHSSPRPVDHYPTDLLPAGPLPHLVVESCTQQGVTLMFDSTWLEHMGFRLSMPLRCVFSGETDSSRLLARPLAFVERSQGAVRSPREIEAKYERSLGSQSPKQWIEHAGIVDLLPKPFNVPMPYYVATGGSQNLSLKCTTSNRTDGSITCKVLIPDGRYALEWLLRVNGTCGPEYRLLEHDISMLWSDHWRQLADETRQRLSVWCHFKPQEKFQVYLLDADFNRIDFGLAGVVVTDQRLIFCKYHHRGAAALDHEGVLHIQVHGEFADLSLETNGHRTKVGKLHAGDIGELSEALKDATGLKMEVVKN